MNQENQETGSFSSVDPPNKGRRGHPPTHQSRVRREKMPKSNTSGNENPPDGLYLPAQASTFPSLLRRKNKQTAQLVNPEPHRCPSVREPKNDSIVADQVSPVRSFGDPLLVKKHLSTFDSLKNDMMPSQGRRELPTIVSLSDLHHGAGFAGRNKSAAAVGLPAHKWPTKDDSFTLKRKGMKKAVYPSKELKSSHGHINKKESQEMQDLTPPEGLEAGFDLDAESWEFVDRLPGNATTIQETQVQHADPSSMFEFQVPHLDDPADEWILVSKTNPVASNNPARPEGVSQTEDDDRVKGKP